MADNLTTGTTLSSVPSGTVFGTDDAGAAGHIPIGKLAISTDGSATLIPATAANGLLVDISRNAALVAGTANIGDVDVLTVPTDPFGANADAASATGSISAKLRFIAATGIPITGTVTVGSHAVTNAGTFAVQDSQVVADNAGFTDGTTKVFTAGFIYDEVAGTALTEDDAAAGRINVNRAQIHIIEDGTTRGRYATVTASNAVKVDGSAVTQPVSMATNTPLGTVASGATDSGAPIKVGGRYNSTPITLTDGQRGDLQQDAKGSTKVILAAPDGTLLTADSQATHDTTFTAVGTTGSFLMALASTAVPSAVSAAGDAVIPWATLNGAVATTLVPHTVGGCSIFRSIDLDEGTLEIVKASAGQIYGGMVTNTATATRWIKFYDAASGTAGTGTPVITFGIPGNSSDDIGAVFNCGGVGVAFATGICVGATTGVADNDTGAPGANDVIINLFYK